MIPIDQIIRSRRKTIALTVEFDGRLNLTNQGWTEATIRPGERVKISGNPERTGGSPAARPESSAVFNSCSATKSADGLLPRVTMPRVGSGAASLFLR